MHTPDIEPSKRPKPAVVDNISKLHRKEKSIYKPSDMWTSEDDLLFLKFCPNIRDRCYHIMSKDLGARLHEILNLKIKDVPFKTINGYVYARPILMGKLGKGHCPLLTLFHILRII